MATAALFNTHLRDNLNFLDPTISWNAVTFQNGWSNYFDATYGNVQYARIGPFVAVRGLMAGGTMSAVAFKFGDLSLRPHRQMNFNCASSSATPRQLEINWDSTSATVYVQGDAHGSSTAWLSVSMVYPTELP